MVLRPKNAWADYELEIVQTRTTKNMDCCSKSGFLDAESIKNDQLTDIKVTPGDFLPEIGISRTVHHHIEISFLAFLDLTNRDFTMGKKLCQRRLLRNYVIIMNVKMMRIIKVLYSNMGELVRFRRPHRACESQARPFMRRSMVNFQLRLSSFPFHFSGKRVCSITLTLKVDFQVSSKYGSNW